jgi:cyclopropane fatty-acyl-phospholipid synthase-like methyltransferase
MSTSATANINDTFFSGLYKDVWRKLVPEGLTEAEVDFIQIVGALQPEAAVLDLMCGYGRHTLELARRGYTVTAIDNLPDYIDEIKVNGKGMAITTQVNSLTTMQLTGTYDAAICMGNSFSFFNKEEARHILHKLSAHLRTGACFIINTWMLGEIAIRHFKEKEWFYAGEYKYLHDCRYLFNPSRIESEHTIITPEGVAESYQGVDYIFTLPELADILKEAGLMIDGVYSTPRKKLFKVGDTRAYITAYKQ